MSAAVSSPARVLALDLGSTGVRASVRTLDGDPVAPVADRRYRGGTAFTAPGLVEPHRALEAVTDAIDATDRRGVRAIAVSTLWQSALPLGGTAGTAHDPAGPALTWEAPLPEGAEHRVREVLDDVYDPDRIGVPLHPGTPAAALAVLPPGFTAVADLAGWITARLRGAPTGWSPCVAAGSGMWDQRRGTWDRPVLDALALTPDTFGPLWTDPLPCGPLAARRWPELAGAVWLPPLGDGLCHNLGLGMTGPGRTAVTIGTSGSVRVVRDDLGLPDDPLDGLPDGLPSAGLWAYRCVPGVVAAGGAVTSAGNVLEWIERLRGGTPLDWSFLDQPAALPTGLRSDPSVFGRRGPDYPWSATGSLRGLRPEHTLEDISRVLALDTLAVFADLHRLLATYLGPSRTVTVAGGAVARHPRLAQATADALGVPVRTADDPYPALRGAARYAGHAVRTGSDDLAGACHALPSGAEATGPGRTWEPRPEWTTLLRRRRHLEG